MTKFLIPVLAIAMLAMPVLAQTTTPTAPAPAKDFGTAAAAPAAGTPAAKPAPAPAPAPAAPAKDFGTATAAPAAGTPAAPAAAGTPTTPAAAGTPATTPPAVPAGLAVDKDGKPIPVLDKDGKPVLGEDGKPVFEKKKSPGGFGDNFLFIMIGMIALMIFMSSRGKKKQQKKHQDMMEGLKKGDRVVSIGGIIGTLVEVKDTEVVIKISDNTRMRMTKGAIRAAGPEVEAAKAEDANSDTK